MTHHPPSSSLPSPTELDTAVGTPAKVYVADGKIIRKLPIATKVEGGTSYKLGFPVCTLSEYVEDQGEAVAELLNRGEAYDKMRAALTPSAETKGAYIGEFIFPRTYTDEYGDEITVNVNVPWTTIKEIMKAISKFAEAK